MAKRANSFRCTGGSERTPRGWGALLAARSGRGRAKNGLVRDLDKAPAVGAFWGEVKIVIPLFHAKNCFLTPHIAWAAHAARVRLLKIAAENIRAYQRGQWQNHGNA